MNRTFFGLLVLSVSCLSLPLSAAEPPRPVKLIFDTDIGNDIDDALALGVIHALQTRGECELLAVTISKDNAFSAQLVDVIDTFYGRGEIPIGMVRGGKTPEDGTYAPAVVNAKGPAGPLYPRKLQSGKDAAEAVGLLRRVLAKQPDKSVVIVMVGFSTNLARLLESAPDEHSPLSGKELAARKCRLLSVMAGAFEKKPMKEYNVVLDVPSARKVIADWPTPIVASGFEVGRSIMYPAVSIERDFGYVAHHPLADAYRAFEKMPYDRPTWDLTSVLYAVRPDRGYFGASEPGRISYDEEGQCSFTPSADGTHRYLTVNAAQIAQVREAFVQLASQPPTCK
jgi:inosine-uridine nucleoside N-ribohydrolase